MWNVVTLLLIEPEIKSRFYQNLVKASKRTIKCENAGFIAKVFTKMLTYIRYSGYKVLTGSQAPTELQK